MSKRVLIFTLVLTFVLSCVGCTGNKRTSQNDIDDLDLDIQSEYVPGAPKAGDPVVPETTSEEDTQVGEIVIEDEETPLSGGVLLLPQATGVYQNKNDKAIIDYSNTSDGYVMVAYIPKVNNKIKSQMQCPDGTVYTYNLNPGYWTSFPLTKGNGSYKVTVLECVGGSKYATVLSSDINVSLGNEFAPFIRPNQYVDYSCAPNTVQGAVQLTTNCTTTLEKVNAVYDWVVSNITYDTQLASNVQSGYLPVLDNVLYRKQGICFDYAALMCGMLRSQLIPCKLIVGYAGSTYHAWISVYTSETGWIDNIIYFDGVSWNRMDPTFASSGKNNKQILQYIGDGRNYAEKYSY